MAHMAEAERDGDWTLVACDECGKRKWMDSYSVVPKGWYWLERPPEDHSDLCTLKCLRKFTA